MGGRTDRLFWLSPSGVGLRRVVRVSVLRRIRTRQAAENTALWAVARPSNTPLFAVSKFGMNTRENHDADDHRGDTRSPDELNGSQHSECATRVLTDGGEQAQKERPADSEESEEESQDTSEEAQDETESEAPESEEAEGESEAEDEAEEEEEAEGEAEAEKEESEEAESEAPESEEAEGEAEEEEEAEAEDEEGAPIISLDLEGLFLNVLGLEVDLDQVQLDVSAAPGPKRLVGNLLSALTGLADGRPSLPSLPSLPSMEDLPLPSPSTDDLPLVSEEESAEGEGEAEGESESESEDEESGGGILAWISSKIRGAISKVIEALPLEEVLAQVATQLVRVILERLEGAGEEAKEMATPTEAEA